MVRTPGSCGASSRQLGRRAAPRVTHHRPARWPMLACRSSPANATPLSATPASGLARPLACPRTSAGEGTPLAFLPRLPALPARSAGTVSPDCLSIAARMHHCRQSNTGDKLRGERTPRSVDDDNGTAVAADYQASLPIPRASSASSPCWAAIAPNRVRTNAATPRLEHAMTGLAPPHGLPHFTRAPWPPRAASVALPAYCGAPHSRRQAPDGASPRTLSTPS